MIATIQAAENKSDEKTARSRNVRRVFGLGLHSWERLMLLSLGATGLIAIAVFLTTASVVILQRHEAAEAQSELEKYKLLVEGKVADAKLEGIAAGKIAGDAIVRAAELEKEAAAARLETEQIKQVVAWRTVPVNVAAELLDALKAALGRVNLRYTSGDPEALFLAIQLSKIFADAGWRVTPGAEMSSTMLFGIHLSDPPNAEMTALRQAFSKANIAFATQEIPSSGMSLGFMSSTIPGAPTLIVGSRSPPLLQ